MQMVAQRATEKSQRATEVVFLIIFFCVTPFLLRVTAFNFFVLKED